jgi:hypothetical protein
MSDTENKQQSQLTCAIASSPCECNQRAELPLDLPASFDDLSRSFYLTLRAICRFNTMPLAFRIRPSMMTAHPLALDKHTFARNPKIIELYGPLWWDHSPANLRDQMTDDSLPASQFKHSLQHTILTGKPARFVGFQKKRGTAHPQLCLVCGR